MTLLDYSIYYQTLEDLISVADGVDESCSSKPFRISASPELMFQNNPLSEQ